VSIHADAYHSTAARGASVYSLSAPASQREAAALAQGGARGELLADIGYGDVDPAVGNILLDIMMDVTTADSARLAEVVVSEIGAVARLVDNSHRHAGYHVLKMPHTPAILVELGYLSNAMDATDLQDEAHQQALADAIAAGLHRYLEGARLDSGATQTP
jgi:N-acetylmuramoyl-L-alanine amidase